MTQKVVWDDCTAFKFIQTECDGKQNATLKRKFENSPKLRAWVQSDGSLTAFQEYPVFGKSVILASNRKISRFEPLVSTSACKHGGVRKKLNINYYERGKEPVNIWFLSHREIAS